MRVALCQLNARSDRDANLKTATELLERAHEGGADLALLPEYADHLGPGAAADDRWPAAMAEVAARLGMWVLAGSYHEAGPDPEHTYNTSLLLDRSGGVAAVYRKIHLYDVDIPGRVSYQESASVSPGAEVVTASVDGVPVGLSICYDLRFPELYRRLAVEGGARVICVPAAFMAHTGRDHWEVLLRARAIENQCYVLAASQIGDHDPGRTCYGRSMVVDPWGTVVAQAPDAVGVVFADLDFERLDKIRAELPSLANRRL
ncbi:carbon-nitrogen hydrolase family protein [Hamadaea tsunoensis]|uniref:carbon-nitrogen hydrolase family protein n=1 Tax=Hamadaea tsunoensis TaxID=53368 RepID=UPI0004011874|nr:carbon-nitrogen hydrolase family protein [Hamadaea tsunoensis]